MFLWYRSYKPLHIQLLPGELYCIRSGAYPCMIKHYCYQIYDWLTSRRDYSLGILFLSEICLQFVYCCWHFLPLWWIVRSPFAVPFFFTLISRACAYIVPFCSTAQALQRYVAKLGGLNDTALHPPTWPQRLDLKLIDKFVASTVFMVDTPQIWPTQYTVVLVGVDC